MFVISMFIIKKFVTSRVLYPKYCCILSIFWVQCILMWEDNRGWTFSLEEALLWFKQWFKLKHHDGYGPYALKLSFSLHKIKIDGLESCGLLWCFYLLFGLSFWRHPFTAEDPLLSKWSNAKLLQMKKQTHLHLGWPEGAYIFSRFLLLGKLKVKILDYLHLRFKIFLTSPHNSYKDANLCHMGNRSLEPVGIPLWKAHKVHSNPSVDLEESIIFNHALGSLKPHGVQFVFDCSFIPQRWRVCDCHVVLRMLWAEILTLRIDLGSWRT